MVVQSIVVSNSQPQQPQEMQPVQQEPTQPKTDTSQKSQFQPVETAEGAKAISEEATQKQIQNLNELLKARNTNVTMDYDSLSSPKRVNIVDSDSGKVIRTMPPEAAIAIAEKAKDYVLGLMFDHKA